MTFTWRTCPLTNCGQPGNERAGGDIVSEAEAESNALRAKADETRRAWEIVARDWNLMAEREERRISNPTLVGDRPGRVD